jgi:hypothetical protein
MLKRASQALLVACLWTGAAWAADNPLIGDWKLNPSRSKMTDTMKVENLGDNKYAFDFGGGNPENIVIDGTDQPGVGGTTLAVSAEGSHAWRVVRKKDGHMLITANWKLSEDGQTLTDNFTAVSPNGSRSTVDYVYKRTGGGPGFAGTWVSTSEAMNFAYVLQIRPYGEDGISIIDSTSQLTRNVKLDGKDYPNAGPNATILATSSVRRLDEHTLELTDKGSNGKVYGTRHLELSSDMKTLTMTSGRSEPNVLVFERQ